MTLPARKPAPRGTRVPEGYPEGFRLRRARNWFFLGLTYASYYLCRYNLSPVAPNLMADLGLSKSQYGLISSGRDGLYAIGQMVNGLLTDRVGGKRAMTIGAVSTIILNLLFGFASWGTLGAGTLVALLLIRSADGFFQAFGSPGFIKINTAWFRRRERGGFSGIFGCMINLGAAGASHLGKLLTTGFTIPLVVYTISVPKLNWHYMFFIPPIAVGVIIVLMNLFVANTPADAGYTYVTSEAPAAADEPERIRLRDVFRKIASNPIVWVVAAAYLSTGFVRRAIEAWWAVYLRDVWHSGPDFGDTRLYYAFGWGLPITASLGSMAAGYISDLLFRGRRAPVAALIYSFEAVLVLAALLIHWHGVELTGPIATTLVIAIAMTCNSTHSILGTAAAMDLGGPRMAGCSAGIIDSFQYYGALLSGWGLGVLFDRVGRASASAIDTAPATAAAAAPPLDPTLWFAAMLPFSALGATLMIYLWLRQRHAGEHRT